MDAPDLRIARLAEHQHGVFSRAQAFACGLSRNQVDGRLGQGLWLSLHSGVYRLRGVATSIEGDALAAVLACRRSACVSHTTAGTLWKLQGVVSSAIEICVRDRGRSRVPGVLVHHPRTLRPRDVTRLGVIPITTPVRTLLDLAAAVDVVALEDALDDAIRRELVTPKAMMGRIRATARNGRRGVVVLEGLVRQRLDGPVSGSSLENRFRRLVRGAGLPPPVAQHIVRDSYGSFVARVDFAYPHVRLAIEVDGYEHHSGRTRWEDDRERQNHLVALGWFPLRVTDRQIRRRPGDVIALVRRRLTSLETASRHQTTAT